MRESEKIEEARFFCSQMAKKENEEHFGYYLSAFLTSSRSILQYALEEAKSKTGGQGWYDVEVSNSKIIQFLKDKRDVNIHCEPLTLKRDIALELSETIHLGEEVSITITDKDGNIKGRSTSKFQPFKSALSKGFVSIRHKFDDWKGDEDVLFICEQYLNDLEELVKDGKSKGFLT